MIVSRRAALRHASKAVAAAALAGSAVGTSALPASGSDAALLRDVARWREYEKEVPALRAERRKREAELPERFRDNRIDPRGWAEDYKDLPVLDHEQFRGYEQAYVRSGLGTINDRLNDLWDAQDPITARVVDAKPTTLAGALAQITVCLGFLNGGVDPDDDFRVKTVEQATRALSVAARMAKGGAS